MNLKRIIMSLIIILIVLVVFMNNINNNQTHYIAHRGSALGYKSKENTVDALLMAEKNGYKDLEFDLQFTKDNVPILKHDIDVNLAQQNYKDVKDQYTSFEDVLKNINKKTFIYPELKIKTTKIQQQIIVSLINKYHHNNVMFQVSCKTDLDFFGQKYKILVLPFNDYKKYSTDDLIKLSLEKNIYIGFNYDDLSDNELSEIKNKIKRKAIIWTVDNKEDIYKLKQYKFYGIMTNEKMDIFK